MAAHTDDLPAAEGAGHLPFKTMQDIYLEVRSAILQGELEPGQPLSQVRLAQRVGSSRTPLREVLRRLEGEGLVCYEQNRRMWVAPLSAVDLEEIYAARIALESMTVRLTVPTMGDAQHAELVQLVDAMDRPEPSAQLIEVHRRFHRAITAASGERIGGLLEDLSDHAIRYRGLYRAIPANHGVSLSEHRGITDACIQGDAALASALVARHLARTALTTLAMLSPERPGTIIRTALQQAAVDKSPSELATA